MNYTTGKLFDLPLFVKHYCLWVLECFVLHFFRYFFQAYIVYFSALNMNMYILKQLIFLTIYLWEHCLNKKCSIWEQRFGNETPLYVKHKYNREKYLTHKAIRSQVIQTGQVIECWNWCWIWNDLFNVAVKFILCPLLKLSLQNLQTNLFCFLTHQKKNPNQWHHPCVCQPKSIN